MSDRIDDLIRDANPLPRQLPAPPIEPVLRRIEREAATPSADSGRGPRRRSGAWIAALAAVAAVAAVVIAIVLLSGGGSGTPTTIRHAPTPATGVRALPCRETVAAGGHSVLNRRRPMLGVVALLTPPGQALQTGRLLGSGRLFAKVGLVVRAGARLRLIVPTALRGRVRIGFGNAGEGHVGTTILVNGCRDARAPHATWLGYVGGFHVTRPVCVPLTIAAGGRRRTIRLGVGTPCPGQRPPAEPTAR